MSPNSADGDGADIETGADLAAERRARPARKKRSVLPGREPIGRRPSGPAERHVSAQQMEDHVGSR